MKRPLHRRERHARGTKFRKNEISKGQAAGAAGARAGPACKNAVLHAEQLAPLELAYALHAKCYLACQWPSSRCRACKMLSGVHQRPSSWLRRSLRRALHAKCYPACASGRAAGAAGACAAPCMQNAIRRASRRVAGAAGACAAPCMQNAIRRASGRVAGAVHAKCYRARASGRAAGAAGACACKMLSGVPRPSSGRRRNSNRSCVLKCCSARKVPSGVPVSEYPAPQGDVTDADSVDTHSIANVVVRRFVVNKVNQFDTWPATTIHDKQ